MLHNLACAVPLSCILSPVRTHTCVNMCLFFQNQEHSRNSRILTSIAATRLKTRVYSLPVLELKAWKWDPNKIWWSWGWGPFPASWLLAFLSGSGLLQCNSQPASVFTWLFPVCLYYMSRGPVKLSVIRCHSPLLVQRALFLAGSSACAPDKSGYPGAYSANSASRNEISDFGHVTSSTSFYPTVAQRAVLESPLHSGL